MANITKLEPRGGSGGAVREMALDGVTRIVKIGIRHGGAIDALIVWYKKRNSGLTENTGLWGGEGGGDLEEIKLAENEYITSVMGHVGCMSKLSVVKSLTLETNLRTYGPYGTQQGYPFKISVGHGGQIVGFHGRCGSMLNAIGVYVKVNYTPGNAVGGGCGQEQCKTCVCGKQVWGKCCQKWFYPCACGRLIWAGCGQPIYNRCKCSRWIWKGCRQYQNYRCICGI